MNQREQFEAYASSQGCGLTRAACTGRDYVSDITDALWKCYQAAQAQQPAPQHIPLTDEQIEALIPDDDTEMGLGEWALFIARAIEKAHGIVEAAITKEKP